MQQFNNYIFKVTKRFIKVYRETKSKIVLDRIIPKSYDGIRELNKVYNTDFSIYGMPLYLKDFTRLDGSYVVEDFNNLIEHEGLNQIVGILLSDSIVEIDLKRNAD